MKYFQDCKTMEDVKGRYRNLAKEHHPDRGGNLQTMQEINREYVFACAAVAKGANLSAEATEAAILSAELYKQAVDKVINLHGIEIELIGAWLWISGNTKQHADYLKSPDNGPKFFFAPKKLMWYFRSDEYKFPNKGKKKSIEEIRRKYGSQKIEKEQQKAIA